MPFHRPPHWTSLTRIAPQLPTAEIEIVPLPRTAWATGDYVVGKVTHAGGGVARLELASGREIKPAVGDQIVGAFGVRAATLEAVGDWRVIPPDGQMTALTGAGLLGHVTSQSTLVGRLIELQYQGHVLVAGQKQTMAGHVTQPALASPCAAPILLILGTSMSAGKTISAQAIVRTLANHGRRVVAAKLTGAGRFRDVLAMQDAGAAAVFDFVDVGLPSTVCPAEEYRLALGLLEQKIAAARPDVVVVEAGASPLEPYNGQVAIAAIRPRVALTFLCASDPYAVVGVTQGFGFQPDYVAGVATSTSAGRALIERLSGVPALNLIDPQMLPQLEQLLLADERFIPSG
jgi:hypothetical protein